MCFPKHLLDGYGAFREFRMRRESAIFKELAKQGQNPKTMLIGCSDSRVAPESIFDVGPGEIFVVRNVANIVPPYSPDNAYHGTSAALEFAVRVLQVENIVVMGHGHCGGVQAALCNESFQENDFIGPWISMMDDLAQRIRNDKKIPEHEKMRHMEQQNVIASIENLYTFPWIKSAFDNGTLQLCGAWFDVSEGTLEILDTAKGQFVTAQ